MSTPTQQTPAQAPSKLATSSHMMKTTKRGRPFLKDTLDLFATLIVSLDLQTHKQYFRSFPNSFTTDEACANLASLKFSQSNRGPDPRDPSRIVTTTTTTTFSMTREMAKAMCQHFMDARLIEAASDPTSNVFKDRGIYMLTPKGLHVLERFISKNGMTADHLLTVFSSQPICLKLLHLERRHSDDEIIISQSVVTALFRRFAGRSANYLPAENSYADPGEEYHERSKGIPLFDLQERMMGGKNGLLTFTHCFSAVSALEWLCDFTSIVARDEAAEMAAHFVRFGLVALVSDKRKGGDSAVIFTVRGNAQGTVAAQGEFRCTAKAVYNITDAGRKVVRWDNQGRSLVNAANAIGVRSSPNNSTTNLDSTHRPSADNSSVENVTTASEVAYGPGGGEPSTPQTLAQTTDLKIHRRISMAEKLRNDYKAGEAANSSSANVNGNAGAGTGGGLKESNSDRLRHILEEPALRSLFREFLRGNFSEENLSFWLDVQDFKRRFNTTSSANAGPRSHHDRTATTTGTKGGAPTPGQAAMEKHHEALISMAFVIYNTYLAPSSPCELNIDHGLRNELRVYLDEVLAQTSGGKKGGGSGAVTTKPNGRLELEATQMQMQTFNATQLQTMIKLYERIQTHVFRLMATDSVPKFIKTSRFMALRNWVEEYEVGEMDLGSTASDDHDSMMHGKVGHNAATSALASSTATAPPAAPPGLDDPEEVGRAYISVSQQALRKTTTVDGHGHGHHDHSPVKKTTA